MKFAIPWLSPDSHIGNNTARVHRSTSLVKRQGLWLPSAQGEFMGQIVPDVAIIAAILRKYIAVGEETVVTGLEWKMMG
jgi:hypothetical protein